MRCDGRQVGNVPSALNFSSMSSERFLVAPAVLTLSRYCSRVLLAIRRKLPSFADAQSSLPKVVPGVRTRRRRRVPAISQTVAVNIIQTVEGSQVSGSLSYCYNQHHGKCYMRRAAR